MGKLMSRYAIAFLLVLACGGLGFSANTKFTNLEVTGTFTADGAANVSGNQVVSGNQTVSGNSTITGNQSVTGQTVRAATSITGVYVSTTVPATSAYVVLTSSSGLLTMTATPAISTTTATNGQVLVIKGVSATNTLTFQDQGTLAGSLVELGASTRVVSDKKVLQLIFDSTLGEWLEMSYGNN